MESMLIIGFKVNIFVSVSKDHGTDYNLMALNY
jgi:hypothetical protein